jgi:CheY-like chemotaxis protein
MIFGQQRSHMSKKPLVAIVDDEKDLVTTLKRYFPRHDIPIAFVAYGGHEAVELFKKAEKKPDVILMDYCMPGLNGIDAARQILAISPEVKIIFLSGERLDKNEARAAGAVTTIQKPASLQTIINVIMK